MRLVCPNATCTHVNSARGRNVPIVSLRKSTQHTRIGGHATDSRTNRGGARRGFILAETLVQNATAGDNGTAGGTLIQPVLGFLVG